MSNPRGVTRRRFLARTATGAGVGMAAPYLLTSAALGNEKKAPANERITLGFIGVRNMGGGHLGRFLRNRRVEVLAVCDVDRSVRKSRAQQVKEAYKNKKEINKMRSILRNYRAQARRLIAARAEQAKRERKQLLDSLFRLGLLEKGAELDDVLALTIRDVLERRIQTLVFRKKIANTLIRWIIKNKMNMHPARKTITIS